MIKSILKKAVEAAGGQTALAERIGKTQGHISKWLQRGYIPPESVLPIERATGISRFELRPDLYPAEHTELRSRSLSLVTQAAEGLMRRRWSLAEIEAMAAAGILLEDERFELIGGEAVPMSPKGNRHELLKASLIRYWSKRIPDHLFFTPETTFRVDEDSFFEPDFVFYDKATGLANLKPHNVLLVVEISDSSLGFDLGRKANLYAMFGVRELWVIDAVKLETHIFRQPAMEGYGEKSLIGPDAELAPDFAPELAVKLAELELI